jgi:hypothetical protein
VVLISITYTVTNRGEFKMKYTAETIQCYPINRDKLSKHLDEIIHKEHTDDKKVYSVAHKIAVVLEPKPGLINEEFIGGEGKYYIQCHGEYDELGDDNKIHHYFDCLPSYEFTFDFADIMPYLMPVISLAEFTKERRGYNARIRNNELEWMRYFNKQEMANGNALS